MEFSNENRTSIFFVILCLFKGGNAGRKHEQLTDMVDSTIMVLTNIFGFAQHFNNTVLL